MLGSRLVGAVTGEKGTGRMGWQMNKQTYIYSDMNPASEPVMLECFGVPANPSATPLITRNSVNVSFSPIMSFRERYAGLLISHGPLVTL